MHKPEVPLRPIVSCIQAALDGSLDATVYRKPPHTDRYLAFQSHHPHHVKRGLVIYLHDRARNITSSWWLVMLPYVSGVSKDIRMVCKRFGLKVIFRSGRSLWYTLTKVKDELPVEKKSKVVYQITCSCGKTYNGKTTRRLKARMKDHQDAWQRNGGEVSSGRACLGAPPPH